jgi:glycosyltransferase involved in cell wall biosynthesis
VRLTVLSVAYPFAPVGPDAVGGAEQILGQLDRALVDTGHRSIVIARADSKICGTLVPVPPADVSRNEATAAAWEHHRRAIRDCLETFQVNVLHMHGIDFFNYLPPAGVPTLITLHLPVSWYPARALEPNRADTWFNCVSRSQHATCPSSLRLLEPIENGVPFDPCPPPHARRRFALMLSRICPEKGIHLAIEAAKAAKIPLLIAGETFSYPDHRRYFETEVRPRLDHWRRFIGTAGARRKQRLLASARCLLLPSLAAETSSLVAREALAAGTPVIAFDTGALSEIIEHGRTGYLVRDAAEMAEAIGSVHKIRADTCRALARAFSLDRMNARYFAIYRNLSGRDMEAGAA